MTATPATLQMRYPAFVSVPDETIAYWLIDAGRIVTDWGDDTDPATMALAAHNMAMQGALQTGSGALPAGVTSFRSGSFSATVSDAFVSAQVKGGYGSTRYGIEFEAMLRRNRGGPRLAGGIGEPSSAGFNGWAGPIPPWSG